MFPSEEELHVLEGEDEEATTSGFSFGAWHFLTIFIVIGVAVVIGYLCLHNRKKVIMCLASVYTEVCRLVEGLMQS